jgi:hypothetical protein
MGFIRKSLAISTLGVVKGSSKKQRYLKEIAKNTAPAPMATQPRLKPGESLTPGGFVRRADGVVIISNEGKALADGWQAAGKIGGLTVSEIVQLVGFSVDAVPAVRHGTGYAHTWSRPGYTIGVLFGPDNRAIGILNGSEQVG